MARLTNLPAQQLIDGFKGVLDYYLWLGIPCARKWPVWHKREPTAAEYANQELFAAVVTAWNDVDAVSRKAFFDLAVGTGLTARDMYVRASMKGLYRYPH
jgi:hypothetical protein